MPNSTNDALFQDVQTRRDIAVNLAIMALNNGHDEEFERYRKAADYLQESYIKILELEIGK